MFVFLPVFKFFFLEEKRNTSFLWSLMLRALDEFVSDLYLREGVGFTSADFTHVCIVSSANWFFFSSTKDMK
jgi:hypothetical protein